MSNNCIICLSSFKNPKHLYTHIREKHTEIDITVPKGAKKDKIEDKIIYSFKTRTEVPIFTYNEDMEPKELNELIIKLKIETLKQISIKCGLEFDFLIKKYFIDYDLKQIIKEFEHIDLELKIEKQDKQCLARIWDSNQINPNLRCNRKGEYNCLCLTHFKQRPLKFNLITEEPPEFSMLRFYRKYNPKVDSEIVKLKIIDNTFISPSDLIL